MRQAMRITQRVNLDGLLTLPLPKFRGVEVEVIILPRRATIPPAVLESARLQAQTGFATTVLASAAEDVWNDL